VYEGNVGSLDDSAVGLKLMSMLLRICWKVGKDFNIRTFLRKHSQTDEQRGEKVVET